MAESRQQTMSVEAWSHKQSDAQFWSNQPDPLQIQRSQAKAIQLVRTAVNPTTTTSPTTVPETSTTQPSEGITELNMTNTSRVPPMVYEGLEEQFLMGDEASQEVMDITANRVTTPVDTEDDAAPLNPIYTQRSQQDKELDLQPSRGPREDSMAGAIDDFLDPHKLLHLWQ